MGILPKLRDFLQANRVAFTHHVHRLAYTARDLAATEHVPTHEVVKTVVYFGDDGYGMAVLSADCMVDLQELRTTLGMSRLRLAAESELAELFPDCELGAMPPFGNLFGLPVYVDSRVAAEETIAFNAGTHHDVVYMHTRDFEALVKPTLIRFARTAFA